jgi:hypothetical protein
MFAPDPLMPRIFISYRREDCPAHAGRLYDNLSAHFGESSVFMDVDTLELGVDFVERIEQAVGSSDVVLALIGPHWLTCADANGHRFDAPNDFVRLELEHGLARPDARVIPVLSRPLRCPQRMRSPMRCSRSRVVTGSR